MEDHTHELGYLLMQAESATLKQAAIKGLVRRCASGAILSYELDGWVVHEHPGGRIERLAPVGQFQAADFSYPRFTPPSHQGSGSVPDISPDLHGANPVPHGANVGATEDVP